MLKLATIVGARPQFIKAAALNRSINQANTSLIQNTLIHTGQHYDANMSDVFFNEMELPNADHNLGVGGLTQGAMTGQIIELLEKIFIKEKPDWVIVFGDTNSTLAGALAAVKLHIPIAHIEAGLRSFNKLMPEEINRILTDHCSDVLFTPSNLATQYLLREGVTPKKINEVGDIMLETALYYKENASKKILKELDLYPKQYVLSTIHRAENTSNKERLVSVFDGLIALSKIRPVVLPLHPRTRRALYEIEYFNDVAKSLKLVEPLGYLDMIDLEMNAQVIVTDSGGVQKEAYFFKVPCLTLRTETEWRELVTHGFSTLVDVKNESLVEVFHKIATDSIPWETKLYGEGDTGKKIIEVLLRGPQ